jgi:DNA-binding winged helix-turn-helix (wHTH) protein
MRFVWGDCELDREARELRRGGRTVHTQPLVLDLLLALLQQRGRVVSEARLRQVLWPATRVTDASLRRLVKEARRAIGDDGERQEQIQTVRGRGILFIAPVEASGGWDTTFVGRADVLAALEQRLEEVAGGLGGVTLLDGPAGMGKSRTLAELQARAELAGFRVLHGSGRTGAQEKAFHPWLEAARELEVEELANGGDAPADAYRRATAEARRFAAFRSVQQALLRAARAQPLLVQFDDFHLADPDSIELLRFLAPAVPRAAVWLVAGYRSGATSAAPLRGLAELAAESSTQSLPLRGLAPEELRALVQNRLRAPVGAGFAALVAERADGNPLFAIEIASSAQRDGRSLEAVPTPELEATLALGLEPLLERRFALLAPTTRAILRAASALGGEFAAATLQAAERGSARDVRQALDEAESAGLIAPLANGRHRFTHPLFGEALYRRLAADPRALAEQHLRIAEALESLEPREPFALARHFAAARPQVRAERVLPFASGAAREAFRRAAFADAEHWYRAAIALAEEAEVAPGEQADLWFELGDVFAATGGQRLPRECYDRGARLARSVGDRRRLAIAALGYAHHPPGYGSADSETLARLREVEALGSGDRALDARIASRLGAELLEAGAEHAAEAEAKLDASLDAARQLGDPSVLARVLLHPVGVRFNAADVPGWTSLARESARAARMAGDFDTEFRARQYCLVGALQLGDRDALDVELAACQRIASDLPTRYARTATRTIEALVALLEGRVADAVAATDEAALAESAYQGSGVAARISALRFWIALERGELSAPPRIERAAPQIANHPMLIATRALSRATSGDVGSARQALDAFVGAVPRLPYDRSRLAALAFAAEVAWRVRARELALRLEAEVRPYAHLGAVLATASVYVGSMSHALGWLVATQGRTTEAIEHFRRGRATHEALRSPVWVERSSRAIAEIGKSTGPRRRAPGARGRRSRR